MTKCFDTIDDLLIFIHGILLILLYALKGYLLEFLLILIICIL